MADPLPGRVAAHPILQRLAPDLRHKVLEELRQINARRQTEGDGGAGAFSPQYSSQQPQPQPQPYTQQLPYHNHPQYPNLGGNGYVPAPQQQQQQPLAAPNGYAPQAPPSYPAHAVPQPQPPANAAREGFRMEEVRHGVPSQPLGNPAPVPVQPPHYPPGHRGGAPQHLSPRRAASPSFSPMPQHPITDTPRITGVPLYPPGVVGVAFPPPPQQQQQQPQQPLMYSQPPQQQQQQHPHLSTAPYASTPAPYDPGHPLTAQTMALLMQPASPVHQPPLHMQLWDPTKLGLRTAVALPPQPGAVVLAHAAPGAVAHQSVGVDPRELSSVTANPPHAAFPTGPAVATRDMVAQTTFPIDAGVQTDGVGGSAGVSPQRPPRDVARGTDPPRWMLGERGRPGGKCDASLQAGEPGLGDPATLDYIRTHPLIATEANGDGPPPATAQRRDARLGGGGPADLVIPSRDSTASGPPPRGAAGADMQQLSAPPAAVIPPSATYPQHAAPPVRVQQPVRLGHPAGAAPPHDYLQECPQVSPARSTARPLAAGSPTRTSPIPAAAPPIHDVFWHEFNLEFDRQVLGKGHGPGDGPNALDYGRAPDAAPANPPMGVGDDDTAQAFWDAYHDTAANPDSAYVSIPREREREPLPYDAAMRGRAPAPYDGAPAPPSPRGGAGYEPAYIPAERRGAAAHGHGRGPPARHAHPHRHAHAHPQRLPRPTKLVAPYPHEISTFEGGIPQRGHGGGGGGYDDYVDDGYADDYYPEAGYDAPYGGPPRAKRSRGRAGRPRNEVSLWEGGLGVGVEEDPPGNGMGDGGIYDDGSSFHDISLSRPDRGARGRPHVSRFDGRGGGVPPAAPYASRPPPEEISHDPPGTLAHAPAPPPTSPEQPPLDRMASVL